MKKKKEKKLKINNLDDFLKNLSKRKYNQLSYSDKLTLLKKINLEKIKNMS